MGKKSFLTISIISVLCILSLTFVLKFKSNRGLRTIEPDAVFSLLETSTDSAESNFSSKKISLSRKPASFQDGSSSSTNSSFSPSFVADDEFDSKYFEEQEASPSFISSLDEENTITSKSKNTSAQVPNELADEQYIDEVEHNDLPYYAIPKNSEEIDTLPNGDGVEKIDDNPDSSTPDGNSSDDSDNSDKTDDTFLLFSNYSSGTYASSLSIELYSSRSESTIYYCVGKWYGTACSCSVSLASSNYFGPISIGIQDGLYCLNAFSLDSDGNRSLAEMLIYNIDKTNLTNPTFVNNKRTHYVQSTTWIKIEDSSSNQLVNTGDKSVYDCADQALQNSPTVIELEDQMLDPSRLDRTTVKNHVYDLASGGTCASMTVVVKDFDVFSFSSGDTSSTDGLSGEITPYESHTNEAEETELVSGFVNITSRY